MMSGFPEDGLPADDPVRALSLQRFAFGLAALALGAQTADLLLHVYTLFAGDRPLFAFLGRPEYGWYVGTPITWGAALASYLLLVLVPMGRPRFGAFILSAMNTFDVFLWLADHAAELRLTLPLGLLQDPWLAQAVRVFQWFELLLFANLAAGTIHRFGRSEPLPALRGARASASLGLAVWGLSFALGSAMHLGWIRRLDMRVVAEIQLLTLFGMVLLAATAFQATVLCATAARQAGRLQLERKKSEDEDDLLRPLSDPFAEEERRRKRDGDPFAR